MLNSFNSIFLENIENYKNTKFYNDNINEIENINNVDLNNINFSIYEKNDPFLKELKYKASINNLINSFEELIKAYHFYGKKMEKNNLNNFLIITLLYKKILLYGKNIQFKNTILVLEKIYY